MIRESKKNLSDLRSLLIEEAPLSALQTVSVHFLIIVSLESVNFVLKHAGCSVAISSP